MNFDFRKFLFVGVITLGFLLICYPLLREKPAETHCVESVRRAPVPGFSDDVFCHNRQLASVEVHQQVAYVVCRCPTAASSAAPVPSPSSSSSL